MARISQIELARKLNVNRSSVSRAVKNGRLTVGADGLLDEDEARRQWYATQSPLPHHQANRARLDELQKLQGQGGAVNGSGDAAGNPLPSPELAAAELIRHQRNFYDMQVMKNKAEQTAIDLDLQAKSVIEMSEVLFFVEDIGRVFAEKFGSLADRYTASVAANKGDMAGTHKALDDAGMEMQNETADYLRLKADKLLAG